MAWSGYEYKTELIEMPRIDYGFQENYEIFNTAKTLYDLAINNNFDLEDWVQTDSEIFGQVDFEEDTSDMMLEIIDSLSLYDLLNYLAMTFGFEIQSTHELFSSP